MSEKIEGVQKICVNIILCLPGKHYSYKVSCTLLGIEPLYLRRTELCIRFIQKTALEPRHSDLFVETEFTYNTRNKNTLKYREFLCRNQRFYNSPLCYLTRLLNSNPIKLWFYKNTHKLIICRCNSMDNGNCTGLPVLLHMLCNIRLICAFLYHVSQIILKCHFNKTLNIRIP